MKLPNGFGNITKLSGNRRNPWRVRKTTGWIDGKQQYVTVGYYPTRQDALQALSAYNADPFAIAADVTFAEIYDRWARDKFDGTSNSNVRCYRAAYSLCAAIHNVRFADLRKSHLQGVIDACGKSFSTLRKIRVLYNQLFKYALENDLIQKDYSRFIDLAKHKDREAAPIHTAFTDGEIITMWNNEGGNEYISATLILIYSGVRIGELLGLKKTNVHLDERYFDVIASKTSAGIRKVPIAAKTLPFFKRWYGRNGSEYLISSKRGGHVDYDDFTRRHWKPLMSDLGMSHLPHDTRHTAISLLARANVAQTIIKTIVGHSGAMSLTERVYTHLDVKTLIDAIDQI